MASEDPTITIEAAAKVAEENSEPKDVVTLSNGIRLRCNPVPMLTMRHAIAVIEKPKPPVIFDKEKGREETWEGDPAYQEALEAWNMQVGMTTLNVMLLVGTKLEHVPKGLDRPEDEGWIQTMEAAGVPIKIDTPPQRYLSWLLLYAIQSLQDSVAVNECIARQTGVMDRDVLTSLESFRGGEGRGADSEPPTEELSTNWNHVSRPVGRPRTRGRRKG